MNKRYAALPLIATALTLSISAAPAFAGKTVKPDNMTCEEFLTLDDEVQPSVIYWMQGKSGEVDEIDVDEHSRPVAYVVTECYKEKQATVWEKFKHYLKEHAKPAPDNNN